MSSIISAITTIVIHIISTLGYAGVGFLMTLQTAAIPIPSEVILPFSGYLVSLGRFNLLLIALSGAIGSSFGASIAYLIGQKGGRPLVEKYGKYILISKGDLDLTQKFFAKFGSAAVFFGQLLPIVRSFIGFAAGLGKENYKKFVASVFVGSFLWSLLLAFVGLKLGENWVSLKDKFHSFDVIIEILIILGLGLWVYKHFRRPKD